MKEKGKAQSSDLKLDGLRTKKNWKRNEKKKKPCENYV